MDRIPSLLKDAKFISSIDLRIAFWQIPLEKRSREQTAFSVPGRGLYYFKVMFFGLVNGATVQHKDYVLPLWALNMNQTFSRI